MSYFGGKCGAGVYQTLINNIPPHWVYVEACLGGGAVLKHKAPALLSIGLDLDAHAIDQYAATMAMKPCDGNVRTSKLRLFTGCGLKFVERAFFVGADLADGPGTTFSIEGYRVPAERVFVYFDPPYPLDTRKCGERYLFEWDDDLHGRLLTLANRLRCKVMISSYPNDRYASALADWRTFTFESQTRSGMATEQVWMNYPEGPLHDYRFLGGDRREREKIRRRVRNWTRGLKKMPPRERLAVFAELMESMRPLIAYDTAASMSAVLGSSAFPAAATLEHAAVDRVWPRCRSCDQELMVGGAGLICPNACGGIIPLKLTPLGRTWRSLEDLRAAYPEKAV